MTETRRQAYRLFGHLYLRGLTPEALERVQAIPDLATALPGSFEADEAAADHYALLSLQVPPHASLFLDHAGQLGGPVADAVARFYRLAGFAPSSTSELPDHLGHALTFLAEVDADNQNRFLGNHLLRWLPVFVLAVRRQGFPFYTALTDLTLDLVLDHHAALKTIESPFSLSDTPDLLNDASTGLHLIARFLTTPPWCGIWLSRGDITRLARTTEHPHGFGDRIQMLTNLLRSAATYDGLDAVLRALHGVVETEQAAYSNFVDAGLPNSVAAVWRARLMASQGIIERLRTAFLDLPDLP